AADPRRGIGRGTRLLFSSGRRGFLFKSATMNNLAADPTFKIYVICTIVLFLELMFLSAYTGAMRGKHKSFSNPEDARQDPGSKPPEADHPAVARVLRTHRNALENLPMFFTMGLVCVLAGANPMHAKICFIGFTVARLLHVVFQLRGAQPWRSM